MLTPVSVSAHTQDFWFPATFPTTALYPRRFHSQKVTYPSPPHHTLEKPGVPSQAPPPAFFWKAVKMLKLFWSSSFFPSLVLFFSTSLVIRVSSDAGKSPWVTIFAMILRYRLAHFLLVSFGLLHADRFSCPCLKRDWQAPMNSPAEVSYAGRQPGIPW